MGVDRDAMTADWEALEAAYDKVAAHDCDALTTREQLAWLERVEKLRRRLPSLEHAVVNSLARQATPEELGAHCRTRSPNGRSSLAKRPAGASARPPTSGPAKG